MKCFYHNDRDAFGVCKSCGKGLCLECMDTSEYAVTCKHDKKCLERAKSESVAYANINTIYSPKQKYTMLILGILFIILGLIVVWAGTFFSILMPLSMIFALILFVIGLANVMYASKMRCKKQ